MYLSIIQTIIVLLLGGVWRHVKSHTNSIGVKGFLNREFTESLKGVAILLVVLHHMSINTGTRIYSFLGGLGVAIFLILSGFGLSESYKKRGLTNFWTNRFVRVVIPYWMTLFIFDLWNQQPQRFVANLLCLGDIHWFVQYVVVLYIIFYFTYKFCHKWRYIILSVLAFSSLIYCPCLQAEQAFSFLVGILISENKNYFEKNRRVLVIGAFILGFLFLALKQIEFIRMRVDTTAWNVVNLLNKFPLAFAFIMIGDLFSKNGYFSFCGKISWEMYLIHCSLLGYFTMYWGYFGAKSVGTSLIYFLICISVSYSFHIINSAIVYRRK